jgi:hypothetical protein
MEIIPRMLQLSAMLIALILVDKSVNFSIVKLILQVSL